jgi:hypothetical protein
LKSLSISIRLRRHAMEMLEKQYLSAMITLFRTKSVRYQAAVVWKFVLKPEPEKSYPQKRHSRCGFKYVGKTASTQRPQGFRARLFGASGQIDNGLSTSSLTNVSDNRFLGRRTGDNRNASGKSRKNGLQTRPLMLNKYISWKTNDGERNLSSLLSLI